MKKRIYPILFVCSALFGASYIAQAAEISPSPAAYPAMPGKAVLYSTKGNTVSGTVDFLPVAEGIKVIADIQGLTPGEHGLHVHAFGDCSAKDAMSAGGHFNPTGQAHGAPTALHHHVGDLGNITANAAGKAHSEVIVKSLSLAGMNSIIGRGVIVHAQKDDLHSQPVGNAGGRVACGVIGITAPLD